MKTDSVEFCSLLSIKVSDVFWLAYSVKKIENIEEDRKEDTA